VSGFAWRRIEPDRLISDTGDFALAARGNSSAPGIPVNDVQAHSANTCSRGLHGRPQQAEANQLGIQIYKRPS
jgi:hypothetical protein